MVRPIPIFFSHSIIIKLKKITFTTLLINIKHKIYYYMNKMGRREKRGGQTFTIQITNDRSAAYVMREGSLVT